MEEVRSKEFEVVAGPFLLFGATAGQIFDVRVEQFYWPAEAGRKTECHMFDFHEPFHRFEPSFGVFDQKVVMHLFIGFVRQPM